jgi:2,3-bisphosphoglycerate-independent phosphoglycerate mutase
MSNRTILIILDGFGIGKDSPFNAINNSKMPFYRELIRKYPHAQLITHGEAVGLPPGVMGNSEVGHMTIGAGRTIYQDLTRIAKSIYEGEFFKNPALTKVIKAGASQTGRVHLMGLLSDGGVHSHIDHLMALLDLCVQLKVPHVSVHAFLDGRDTPPNSGIEYLKKLLTHPTFSTSKPGSTRATLATMSGRYWAMDRDKRWERVARAYQAMTGQAEEVTTDPIQTLLSSYSQGKTDEFVDPVLFSRDGAMKDGDSVIFYNYRSDRAREISHAILDQDFHEFDRKAGFKPSAFAGMATYDNTLTHMEVAFGPQNFDNIFGQWLEKFDLSQFRIAETEKYAHVTFFFNGGREKPFEKEERILIPSPKDVPTYDLKPEMSAFALASEAANKIREQKYNFVLMNFANADMVGHTGNYEATVKAMEALDSCLAQVVGAGEASGYHTLITADHGNAEELRDEQNRIHTQHTLNPVPVIWVPPNSAIAPQASRYALKDGNLSDIMPTLCELMGLKTPEEVTGKSLLPEKY